MSDGENVKVAVRVRPFNGRERARNATLIVDMKGPTTYLQNPEDKNEEPRKFAFDFSYWSHDGSRDRGDGYYEGDPSHPNGKKFCDQKRVYDNLGEGILTNAWEGYNSTLFAYGQTGSGKSWSMVGYGINKGIVPLYTEKMFKDIDEKKVAGDTEYEVLFSMLEIYNEQVRDLLNTKTRKGGLRVRQHPKMGFYAEGLTESAVGSYNEIESKIEEGTCNRTVASTNMNATSSRAHTIVGITLSQKFKNAAGEDTTKTAVVNLVDLAGSERAESTGATGDRLKEGAAINQSLSSLGNVIAALADRSNGKNVRVPFRDSMLTKLLKNALGGNSKTIMIAAVSPADINYDESLSTLRYADRAKQIKTVAKVNEDPTEKLIRELSEENERLKKMLQGGGIELPKGSGEDGIEETEGMTEEEKAALKKELEDEYKAELEENERQMQEMQKSFEEKLRLAQENSQATSISETAEKKKSTPHISNLNVDAQLSGKIIYFLDAPEKKIGSQRGDTSDITIIGKKMLENHAKITDNGSKFFIEKDNPDARILLNGGLVNEKEELDHNDRLVFGTNQMYLFVHPKERDASKEAWPEITYEFAQEEIAAQSGFDMNTANKSRDDMLLQEDLMEMLPAVEEANAISQELDKKMKFEVIIVSPEARGELKGRTEIMVKLTNLETDHEWVWTKAQFLNRKYVMQEMYEDYQDGEDVTNRPVEKDPFVEDEKTEVYIGSVKIWLQSLAYQIESKEQLEITNIKGEEAGLLNVEVMPCNKKGKEYTEKDDIWVEKPGDLVGKPVYFMMKIVSARGLPSKFTDVYAKFKVYLDEEFVCTQVLPDTSNPDWAFQKQYSYDVATEQFVQYLSEEAIMVQIWGKQKPGKAKKHMNTKAILQRQSLAKGQVSAGNTNVKTVDPGKVKFMMLSSLMEKKSVRLEQRMNWMRTLVETAEKHKKKRVSVKSVRGVLDAPSEAVAGKHISTIPKERNAEHSDSSDDEGSGGSKTCTLM